MSLPNSRNANIEPEDRWILDRCIFRKLWNAARKTQDEGVKAFSQANTRRCGRL